MPSISLIRPMGRKVTKAVLVQENNDLRLEVSMLREQIQLQQQSTRVPSAVPVGRVVISSDNPIFAHLPTHTPHRKMKCAVHGVVTANKIGKCVQCVCAIALGGRAIA